LWHPYKIIDAMFRFFAGNKSSSEATFAESAAGGFVEATTSSTRFVESATTGLKSTLLYCHLNCLVKPPFPQGGIYFICKILNRELRKMFNDQFSMFNSQLFYYWTLIVEH
jgi:hypothetical protein